MAKQVKHIRHSSTGKRFFAGKKIPDRYFIGREQGKPQPNWTLKNPSDKPLGYYPLVEVRQYPSAPYADPDHDGIANIFDKQPLNPANRHQVPPTVPSGNLKLFPGIGIWSLPRLYTCPGATPLCKKFCYAEGPEKYYGGGVVYSRNKNWAWTKRPDFARIMSEIINNHKWEWFRIHEAGDFYNQDYLNKWIEIAKACPNTKFLAYTKAWMHDFSQIPENFTVRYSSDISSKHIIKDLPACFTGIDSPINFFLCKKKCKPGFCMACWDKHTDVFIPVHSISKKDEDHMFFKQFNPKIPDELAAREKFHKHLDPNSILVKVYGLS